MISCFTLKNKITISNATKDMFSWCKDNLEFINPDYVKKERMGKWTGSTEKFITLYEINGNDLILPFGVCQKFYKEFKGYFSAINSIISPIRARNYNSNIQTYDYQETGVQAVLKAKNGILVAPCGSGKTQMGLEIIARIGGKALWITHTQDLLNQSMERAKANYMLPLSEYGTITAGKVNIGNTITFATVQTLSNIDLIQYSNEFDVIIVDECHKCVGTPTQMMMFYKVLSNLSARYKIGLTATPYRADGLEKSMFALLGDIIYEIPKSAVADKTCDVEVVMIETGFKPNTDLVLAGDGTLIYSKLVEEITKDIRRNQIIVGSVGIKDGATLVLSDRVEHLSTLKGMLGGRKKAEILSASNTKAEKERRKVILKELNEGNIDVVFATYKLAKEGLDVPNLRYVVFATPIKDKTTVIQSAGRVGRKAEGKTKGVVIDFDDDFGLLKGYTKKRNGYYKKLGYKIN